MRNGTRNSKKTRMQKQPETKSAEAHKRNNNSSETLQNKSADLTRWTREQYKNNTRTKQKQEQAQES